MPYDIVIGRTEKENKELGNKGLVFYGKVRESKKWWILLAILAALIGIMGRIVTLGGMAR